MNEPGLAGSLLASARTIAVVGYSPRPDRPSNSVSQYLRAQGYRIVPVNPLLRGQLVDGEQSYDQLVDIPADVRVDFIDGHCTWRYCTTIPAATRPKGKNCADDCASARGQAAGFAPGPPLSCDERG